MIFTLIWHSCLKSVNSFPRFSGSESCSFTYCSLSLMSLSLFWKSRLLLRSFLRTYPSSVPLSVGMFFCCPFSSFFHYNTVWDLTLIRFCRVFLSEISFLELEEGGCIQGSFSNFTELPLLLLFCKSMVAGFLRGPGSLLTLPRGLDTSLTSSLLYLSCSPWILPQVFLLWRGPPGLHCAFCAFCRPWWVPSSTKNAKSYILQLCWYEDKYLKTFSLT